MQLSKLSYGDQTNKCRVNMRRCPFVETISIPHLAIVWPDGLACQQPWLTIPIRLASWLFSRGMSIIDLRRTLLYALTTLLHMKFVESSTTLRILGYSIVPRYPKQLPEHIFKSFPEISFRRVYTDPAKDHLIILVFFIGKFGGYRRTNRYTLLTKSFFLETVQQRHFRARAHFSTSVLIVTVVAALSISCVDRI